MGGGAGDSGLRHLLSIYYTLRYTLGISWLNWSAGVLARYTDPLKAVRPPHNVRVAQKHLLNARGTQNGADFGNELESSLTQKEAHSPAIAVKWVAADSSPAAGSPAVPVEISICFR
jgi:hypothetical protein